MSAFTSLAEALAAEGGITRIGVAEEAGETALSYAGMNTIQKYFGGEKEKRSCCSHFRGRIHPTGSRNSLTADGDLKLKGTSRNQGYRIPSQAWHIPRRRSCTMAITGYIMQV